MKFVCPYCFESQNTTRGDFRSENHKCSKCAQSIPYGYSELKNPFIALVGSRGSGKTVYITVLIDQLMNRVCKQGRIGGVCDACGDDTRTRYEAMRDVLQDGRLPGTTRPAVLGGRELLPLIFRLRTKTYVPGFYPIPSSHSLHLVFFDAAGEDMLDESLMAMHYRYFHHAAAVIFLIDPLQIRKLSDKYEAISRDNLEKPGTDQHIVSRFVSQYRQMLHLSADAKLKIPAAFVLSKSDILVGSDGLSEETRAAHDHKRGFDLEDQLRVSKDVGDFVGTHHGQLLSLSEEFLDHSFFAVSALGKSPEKDGRILGGPVPFRVEDPLLWILWRLGYVSDRYDIVGADKRKNAL